LKEFSCEEKRVFSNPPSPGENPEPDGSIDGNIDQGHSEFRTRMEKHTIACGTASLISSRPSLATEQKERPMLGYPGLSD
jgi:hypothetical protein